MDGSLKGKQLIQLQLATKDGKSCLTKASYENHTSSSLVFGIHSCFESHISFFQVAFKSSLLV